ncbi:MAG: DUF4340 domain-containing protein [Planctomycetota bacterium]
MSRSNLILAILAVLQLAALIGFRVARGAESDGPAAGGALTSAKPADVARIEIRDGGGDGATIELARQGEGWVVASRADYPADAGKVTTLLERLAEVRLGHALIRSARNHGPVKVAEDDFARRVTLKGAGGAVLADLFAAPGSGARSAYLRRAGEDPVYESEDLTTADLRADVASWIDGDAFKVDTKDVVALEIARKDGTALRFERRQEAPPTLPAAGEGPPTEEPVWYLLGDEDARTKPKSVEDLLDDLAGLAVADVAGRKDSAGGDPDEVEATVTLRRAGGDPTILVFGPLSETSGQRALESSASPFRVEVANWRISTLFTRTRDDFVDIEKPANEIELPGNDDASPGVEGGVEKDG